jgi:hypothetical protein
MPPSDLLGSGRTRGLSGDAQRVLPGLPGLAFFDQHLRRHHTTEDLVADPAALWDGPAPSGRAGLRRHLMEEPDAVLGRLSDILMVVNRPDWVRATRQHGDQWLLGARKMLRERFRAWCLANGVGAPARPVHFRVIMDGGPELVGDDLGLRAGDAVSGLLPNLHLGAETTAAPLYDVLAFAPGEPGWSRLATLHGDQRLLTLGNHWLDNARHERLPHPALYQLRRTDRDRLVHLIHPELRDRYRVESRPGRGGQPVLAILEGDQRALLYLAIVPSRPTPDPALNLGLLDEVTLHGRTFEHRAFERIGTVGEPDSASEPPGLAGAGGIEPTSVESRILSLREQGVLLQVVHFSKFIDGYDVSISADGRVASRLEDPVAVVKVRGRQISLQALTFGVKLDRVPLDAGDVRALVGDHHLRLPGASLNLRDLRQIDAEGWPYLAEIRRSGDAMHAVFGGRLRVGRSSRCRVRLPDDPWNGNIHWRPEIGDGTHIRSRHGALPRARFYLDAIMVAAEHAEIDLTGEPLLHALSRGCYTFVRRGGLVQSLPPVGDRTGDQPSPNLDLRPGDEILVGNCVLEVDYPPATEPRPVRDQPRDVGPLRATDLAAAMTFDAPPSSTGLPRVTRAPGPGDAPVAASLGERGPAPPRPRLQPSLSEDSLEVSLADHPDLRRDGSGASPRGVRAVSASDADAGLSQRARLRLVGWRLQPGETVTLGNHEGAGLVLPDLRTGERPHQITDHVRVLTTLREAAITALGGVNVRVRVPLAGGTTRVEIDHVGPGGQVDRVSRLDLTQSPGQPLLLRILGADRDTRRATVLGVPSGDPAALRLGRTPVHARWHDGAVHLAWGGRRRVLGPGERVVIDAAVYEVEVGAD